MSAGLHSETIHLGLGLHNNGVSDASVKANLAICTVPGTAGSCVASCSVDDTAKEKAKVDSKELAMCTLVKNKHKTMIGGQKKLVFWWSKGKKGRKGLSKGKNTFSESDSRTLLQEKGSDKEFQSNKGTSKDQRRKKERKSLFSFRILCLRVAK